MDGPGPVGPGRWGQAPGALSAHGLGVITRKWPRCFILHWPGGALRAAHAPAQQVAPGPLSSRAPDVAQGWDVAGIQLRSTPESHFLLS